MNIVACERRDEPADVVRRGGPGVRVGRLAGPGPRARGACGDRLAVLSAGAYGMSMASNYNSRGRAAEVLVDGAGHAGAAARGGSRPVCGRIADRRRRATVAPALDPPLLHRMARDLDAVESLQRGPLAAAARIGMRAARVEGTAARRIQRIRHLACTGVRARPLMWVSGIASSSIRVYGWRGLRTARPWAPPPRVCRGT